MKNNRNINSSEIAKLAGVSRSTVSKVINNYADIPEQTKIKVLDVIAEHKYKPNQFASVLKGIPQKVIALYLHTTTNDAKDSSMSNIDSSYVMGVVSHFIMATKKHGHSLRVEMIEENEGQEAIETHIRDVFNSKSICAAVFVGLTDNCKFIDRLVEDGYAIASIDRIISEEGTSLNVITSDENSAKSATQHLIESGYTNIAFIGGDETKLSARNREKGYRIAIEESNLEAQVISCGFSQALASEAANKFDEFPNIEALVCASDTIAHSFIGTLRKTNPNRLSQLGFIGFENTAFNSHQSPSLTSVAIDYQQMAHDTVESLLSKDNKKSVIVNTNLVIRDSSKKKR
ncbi:LacI family transcriptional regulator [Photobacterium sp. ZSDE20]|uniref:LacI family transcriptional regulator n=1 Tax=Photobacterium pectinilyticum TaxID=2906793 RepID=A0ABT1N4P8_9GAMM|nr:LacI family DNA-binding transcriptional regulator [Photobacterium sp. ZSDE20]MCQ1059720.1 LacI family transcriptional regulator [Photobacterium sp. ZSDE20]MDD1825926.1 LacI family transcriptional regulator [Photobacterium sp. ZSDE20]